MPIVRIPKPSGNQSEPTVEQLRALAQASATSLHGAKGYNWVDTDRLRLHSRASSVSSSGRFSRNLMFGRRLRRSFGPFAQTSTNPADPDVEVTFTSGEQDVVVEATGRHVLDTYRFLERFAAAAGDAGWLAASDRVVADLDRQRQRQIGQRSD